MSAETITTVKRDKSRSSASSSQAASAAITRPFSLRGFTSILLMLCVLMVLASGIVLYLAPRGRVANWMSWTALDLSRQQWIALHINASMLFVVVTVSHLVMNWSRLVGYLKKKSQRRINMKKELASAVAVAFAIFAATILNLPPINLPAEFRHDVRDYWEQAERTDVQHSVAHQPLEATPSLLAKE